MRRVATLTLVLALAACGEGAGAETTTTTELTTTTTSSTTTTTTTTTTTLPPPPTTVSETTTTTESLLGEPETAIDAALQALLTLALMRDPIIDTLADLPDVESVDKVVIDAPEFSENLEDVLDTVLEIEVTSRWRSADNQEDGAWTITRVLSILWGPDNPNSLRSDLWMPPFRLTNSGTVYLCSGEFMADLAATRAGRSDWLRECS